MIKQRKKKFSLPDPYDDDYEAVFDALDRLSKDEQAKILQRVGILGPDGQLAPAYADDESDADEAASTK